MTYELVTTTVGLTPHPGILCLICLRVSYNRHDIAHRYCGHCHRFHEDPQLPEMTR
jgi:hypothetical protein